jgi:hypothetical protein
MQRKLEMEKKELEVLQMTLVITRYPPEQLTRETTLPRYGTGLSMKFVCFSAWSLTLYKALQDPGIQVVASGGQQCNRPANRLPVRKTLGYSRHGTGATLSGGRLPWFAEEVDSTRKAPVLR